MKTVTVQRWDELKRHAAIRVEIRLRVVGSVRSVARLGQVNDENPQPGDRQQ